MRISAVLLVLAAAASLAVGQGDFVNFEVPQVKPIDVIDDVMGSSWVLACNTPDNSVEIYEVGVGGAELTFRQRIPTGLSPVTVRYVAGQIYVANYIGDSITRIEFPSGGSAVGRLRRTEFVGDSPTDFAIDPLNTSNLQVVISTSSELRTVDATTLLPVGIPPIPLIDTSTTNAERMKEPRRVLYGSGALANIAFFLNFRGDNGVNPLAPGVPFVNGYDFDLLVASLAPPAAALVRFNGLGTANSSMVFDAGGSLYVVGSRARNDVADKVNLRALNTGFVESWIWRIDGTGAVTGRNLNLDSAGTAPPLAPPAAQVADPVSMPTDVVIREPGGGARTIYVTSFQSDRIVALDASTGAPSSWGRTFLVPSAPLGGYSQTGPRGLALKESNALVNDPGARLYSLNRLDNSISVFDPDNPATGELVKLGLNFDPTPAVVRTGRQFLYDSRLTSGTGMVACGSCHLDGRTDGLAWKLDGPTDPAVLMPVVGGVAPLLDGVRVNAPTSSPPLPLIPWNPAAPDWPGDRQLKVTQTLQGLLNHPVGQSAEVLFTNAPYHWRADKSDFLQFNEAFVNLQRMTSIAAPSGAGAAGLTSSTLTPGTPGQMDGFRDFINTIMYPPNPEQDLSRRFREDDDVTIVPGTTAATSTADGTNARRGLELFHTRPINQVGTVGVAQTGGRSCVQCHTLPEGSNNRITVRDNTGGGNTIQPLETAAIRGLKDREGSFVFDNTVSLPPNAAGALFPNANAGLGANRNMMASTAGLLQGGGNGLSINSFLASTFLPLTYQLTPVPPGSPPGTLPGPAQGTVCAGCPTVQDVRDIEDLSALMREFDSGIAPIIGVTRTYDSASAALGQAELAAFGQLESTQANCDLVVYREVGGVYTGYYYDVALGYYVDPRGVIPPPAPPSPSTSSLSGLFAGLLPGDRVIAMAVPVGSGRRIADLVPASSPLPPAGTATPSAITLQSLVVAEPWQDVPGFSLLSSLDPASPDFTTWLGTGVTGAPPFPGTMSALFGLQASVIANLPLALHPSLTASRHEAPRRFRVTGTDIAYGATLRIGLPGATPPAPGSTTAPPASTLMIDLPLFPNTDRGALEWQTAAEIDPFWVYILMNGGFAAPGVAAMFGGDISVANWFGAYVSLNPAAWNSFWIQVINPGGAASTGSWQQISLP